VSGLDPEPGLNEIEIFVDDTNNSGADKWATTIGSASIQVDGLYPVVMIHGNNSCGNFFAGDYRTNCEGDAPTQVMPESEWFIKPFKDQKIPFDNSITMPTDNVLNHALWLLNGSPEHGVRSLKSVADEWGVQHVHIIAHSKGGLDMRQFLALLPSGDAPGDLAILTFTTLSSPHAGSVGADYTVDAESLSWKDISRQPGLSLRFRTSLSKWLGSDLGKPDLRVSSVLRFNADNIKMLPWYFTVKGENTNLNYYGIGADANLDDSATSAGPTIQTVNSDGQDETKGLPEINMPISLPGSILSATRDFIYTDVYRVFWEVRETTVRRVSNGFLGYQRLFEIPNDQPQRNDFAVTVNSATYEPLFSNFNLQGKKKQGFTSMLPKNHATLATPGTADLVISFIHESQVLGRH
jgi:pimeloyl-ACP methyl ester carboxylesterase